jgi:hypothetical protein
MLSAPQASFRVSFSGGQTGSPVSTSTLGECNAITKRSLGESAFDFWLLSETASYIEEYSHKEMCHFERVQFPRYRLRTSNCTGRASEAISGS